MALSDCVMIPAIRQDSDTIYCHYILAAMTLCKVYNLECFVSNVTTMYISICINNVLCCHLVIFIIHAYEPYMYIAL